VESDRARSVCWPRDDQEGGYTDGTGNDSAEQYRIEAPAQVAVDEDGEDQVANQERLDECERPVSEREDLKGEADHGPADRCQP
jgi:hypothetical protein